MRRPRRPLGPGRPVSANVNIGSVPRPLIWTNPQGALGVPQQSFAPEVADEPVPGLLELLGRRVEAVLDRVMPARPPR